MNNKAIILTLISWVVIYYALRQYTNMGDDVFYPVSYGGVLILSIVMLYRNNFSKDAVLMYVVMAIIIYVVERVQRTATAYHKLALMNYIVLSKKIFKESDDKALKDLKNQTGILLK